MKKNNWNALDIKARDLEKKISEGKIKIPTYQRGIVWDDKMQKGLINSLKEGFPFGSLLIYKYDDANEPWLLIDGLQRSTAIFKFIKEPADFFDEDDISDIVMFELVGMIDIQNDQTGQVRSLKKLIKDWVYEHKTSDDVRNIDPYKCADIIMDQFPILTEGKDQRETRDTYNSITAKIKPIFDNYKNLCIEVEERDIPYIEITGSDESLPEIFYRINDRGVKLTKQNKFAASWSDDPIKMNDNMSDLVSLVRQRYDEIESQGTRIYNYDSSTFHQESKLDIFEISYGLGKYLGKEFPHLFQVKKGITAVDTIGFILINACLNGTKDTLHNMNKKMTEYNEEDINKFLQNIISCIKYVDEQLAIVTKFKGNKRLGKGQLHTDFQIISIIASVFKLKHYIISDDELICDLRNTSRKWNDYDRKLRKSLITHYIYDIINGYWAGHGDNTLDDRLHNRSELYCTEVKKSAFESAVTSWYEINKNMLAEKVKDVKSPKEADKVLLYLIYVSEFSAQKQLDSSKFDIEHLVPKKLAENVLERFKGELKLPISSFGNLCLLPEHTNRKKKAKIIYDDDNYIEKLNNKELSVSELEQEYTFTTKKDLDWLNDNSLTKEEIEANYYQFIDTRFERLKDKIINILY